VGIDPGASGALAVLQSDGSLIAVHDMPTVEVLVNRKRRPRVSAAGIAVLLRQYMIEHVYLERVGSMPGEGAAGAFTFGVSYGLVEGTVATLGLAYTLITPQSWKKAASVAADKGQARQRAMQLWPAHAANFLRVKDDGRAEAALLAWVGLQTRQSTQRAGRPEPRVRIDQHAEGGPLWNRSDILFILEDKADGRAIRHLHQLSGVTRMTQHTPSVPPGWHIRLAYGRGEPPDPRSEFRDRLYSDGKLRAIMRPLPARLTTLPEELELVDAADEYALGLWHAVSMVEYGDVDAVRCDGQIFVNKASLERCIARQLEKDA
jgi:crossover junction endodeoxyribonuclease RuvC